jgi:hypothetical protein
MHTQIRMRIVIRILTLVQDGKTPVQVAEEMGHASIATLIRNAGSVNLASASAANAAAAAAGVLSSGASDRHLRPRFWHLPPPPVDFKRSLLSPPPFLEFGGIRQTSPPPCLASASAARAAHNANVEGPKMSIYTVSDMIAMLLEYNNLTTREGFETFDDDEDNMISMADLTRAAETTLSLEVDAATLKEWFQFYNTSGSGMMSEEEWNRAMTAANLNTAMKPSIGSFTSTQTSAAAKAAAEAKRKEESEQALQVSSEDTTCQGATWTTRKVVL